MESALLVNNNRKLLAINNLIGTYREYNFWRILQYVYVFYHYFIIFHDKIPLDIEISYK